MEIADLVEFIRRGRSLLAEGEVDYKTRKSRNYKMMRKMVAAGKGIILCGNFERASGGLM